MNQGDIPVLDIQGITLRFGGVTALDRVSFSVHPANIHALIGPNGAGKSSCFNVISGLYRSTEGTIKFGDEELTRLKPHRIAALGISRAFQNLALADDESVIENLMVARFLLTKSGYLSSGMALPSARAEEKKHRARVVEIAELVGVSKFLDLPVGLLPYGIRKKVEITRAICAEPRLLLLDEPVAGMTHHEKWDVAQTILDIRSALGISILLVEHDMSMVMSIADRVSVLDFGRVIADGSPERVQNDPHVLNAYLGDALVTTHDGDGDTEKVNISS